MCHCCLVVSVTCMYIHICMYTCTVCACEHLSDIVRMIDLVHYKSVVYCMCVCWSSAGVMGSPEVSVCQLATEEFAVQTRHLV